MSEIKNIDVSESDPVDEISLIELFDVLWARKKLIISVTAIFALCSVFYALSLTNYYKSEAIYSLAGNSDQTSALSGYGALASIAGINLPSSGIEENKAALVIATIKSRAFLKHLMTFEGILPSLMAAKTFDLENQILVFDEAKYNTESRTWVKKDSAPFQSRPSVLETYKKYRGKMLSVSLDSRTGFILISVEHESPIFAKEFLDLIVNEVNTLLREKDLQESSNALDYLQSEISKTSLIEIKNSINQLIQSRLETQMVAKIRKDYMLRTIEPPFVPEEKSRPNRALICILGVMLGGFLSVLWVLISNYALRNSEE